MTVHTGLWYVHAGPTRPRSVSDISRGPGQSDSRFLSGQTLPFRSFIARMRPSIRLGRLERELKALVGRTLETHKPAARQLPSRQYSSYTSPHLSKPPRQGQPLHHSHPHLVNAGDLTPGTTAAEYEGRRRKLMASLPEGAVVICMGGTVRLISQRESIRHMKSFADLSEIL
jgi:hypothetical protein